MDGRRLYSSQTNQTMHLAIFPTLRVCVYTCWFACVTACSPACGMFDLSSFNVDVMVDNGRLSGMCAT